MPEESYPTSIGICGDCGTHTSIRKYAGNWMGPICNICAYKLSNSSDKNTSRDEQYNNVVRVGKDNSSIGNSNIEQKQFGYIRRHWRGESSLAISFWCNWVLLSFIISKCIDGYVDLPLIEDTWFSSITAIAILAIIVLLIFSWQVVGLWRSCNRRKRTTGKKLLAGSIHVLIAYSVLIRVVFVINYAPIIVTAFRELWVLNHGYTVTMNNDNTSIRLRGAIGSGVSEQVEILLVQYPDTERIILDSGGGLVREGRLLGEVIREHDLDTYSLEDCFSACTIAFIEGKKRYLGVGARLGFHQQSLLAQSYVSDQIGFEPSQDQDRRRMIARGVKREFTNKLFLTASNDMWYPSNEEMIDAGVIHGVVKASEIATTDWSTIDEDKIVKMLVAGGFSPIREHEPETWKKLIADTKQQFAKGITPVEVQALFSQHAKRIGTRLARRTSDEALIGLLESIIEFLRECKEKEPVLCLSILYPEEYPAPNVSKILDINIARKFSDSYYRIILDAYERPKTDLDETMAEATFQRCLANLDPSLMELDPRQMQDESDYVRSCDCALYVYESMLGNKDAESANAMRYWLSIN